MECQRPHAAVYDNPDIYVIRALAMIRVHLKTSHLYKIKEIAEGIIAV